MKLIVGLGNVGREYASTRHNLGWRVLDELARAWELGDFTRDGKWAGESLKSTRHGQSVVLLKPQTMMNLSGRAVVSAANFYKLLPSDIWVVYDELAVPFGKLRIRRGGGSAGHNGINSIISELSSDQFARFRVGIGPLPEYYDHSSFVLERFKPSEEERLDAIVKTTGSLIDATLASDAIADTTHSLI